MKNLYLFICLLLFSYSVIGQNESIDSFKTALQTLPKDTGRVNVLNNITAAFIQKGSFDSAFHYAIPAAELAEKLHFQNGAFYAYHNLAECNFHIQEYKPGRFFLIKALNAALQTGNKKNAADAYKELADLYQLQGNFKLAEESKEKFTLYSDSAQEEERFKEAEAFNRMAKELKEKKKAELQASDAKALAINETKKQQIFYISLAVLLVLSVLLVLLLVNRSKQKEKRKAALEENMAEQQGYNLSVPIKQKDIDTGKISFLQKIAEKEALEVKNNGEKIVLPPAEKIIEPASEENITEENIIANNDIATETDGLIDQPTEIEPDTIEKNDHGTYEAIVDEPSENKLPIVTGRYSRLIRPDQLSEFTAKLVEGKVKFSWKTHDNGNISHFSIEKSVDNQQFINIETVAANISEGSNYEIFDLQPVPGNNYYRLELIDKAGDFIYSQLIKIEVLPANTLELICYPVKVKDIIMVTAAGGKQPVLVNIYNFSGKKEFSIEVPPTTTPIYLNSLAAGIYTLQMKCQGKTVLQQLIKGL